MIASVPLAETQHDPPQLASWVEVSPERVRRNLLSARACLAPGNRFCAVLKADAYGHGIRNVLPVLMQEGVDFIAITSNDEAREARAMGFRGRILRLRPATLPEAEAASDLDVEEQVGSAAAARELSATPPAGGGPRRVHLALNAGGMGRDGVELSNAAGRQVCGDILQDKGLRIVGLMTHFPSNSPDDLAASRREFDAQVSWVLSQPGVRREDILVHAGSSLTLMARATQGYDMVRCGAVLYGIVGPRDAFATTMTLKARVSGVGDFPQGASVGYDRACRLVRDSRLASVAIGYANGFRRCFGNVAHVLIRGQRLPVLGKISMNSLVVDVTDLPEVAINDAAILFGRQDSAEISPAEVEAQAGTILADLFLDWGRSNPRRIVPG
ncbi:alanine racemase [Oceanibium sediminis]|uniref:alanine racemase n=1 Tax=Oceanibium sediminis TaxID=2026339 RepID=UPI000DD2C44E|nr:alanine racemase [Oceanibium sediminis]